MQYDYRIELTMHIRHTRALESKTNKIETARQWRAVGGKTTIADASIYDIYDAIKYTLDESTANNFMKEFGI